MIKPYKKFKFKETEDKYAPGSVWQVDGNPRHLGAKNMSGDIQYFRPITDTNTIPEYQDMVAKNERDYPYDERAKDFAKRGKPKETKPKETEKIKKQKADEALDYAEKITKDPKKHIKKDIFFSDVSDEELEGYLKSDAFNMLEFNDVESKEKVNDMLANSYEFWLANET